ncbi:MAG: PorT family protein [Prevotellaceae bacterium]|jgi:hypothetical protein|nr:PorT family protein [Prevotellaceae bacterium]
MNDDRLKNSLRQQLQTYESPVEPGEWEAIDRRLTAIDEAQEKVLLQAKLTGYEQPVMPADWEIINRQLQQSKRRRAVAAWCASGSAVAAAALLFFVLHPLVTQQNGSVDPPATVHCTPPAAVTPEPDPMPDDVPATGKALCKEPMTAQNKPATVRAEPLCATKTPATPAAVSLNTTDVTATIIPSEPEAPATDTLQSSMANRTEQIAENKEKAPPTPQPTPAPQDLSATFPLEDNDETPSAKTTKQQWAIALLAEQAGGNPFSNTANNLYTLSPPSGRLTAPRTRQVVDTRHAIPLSVGLTFRFYLPLSKWALETGLVYTYLASEYSYSDNATAKQQVHYLGVPVNIVYQFVDAKYLSFYAAGGGMIEKGLATDSSLTDLWGTHNDTEDVKGLQWSLNGQLGIEYRFYGPFSVYFEPGVRYFFPSEDQPESLRTDQPFTFILGCGLRTRF